MQFAQGPIELDGRTLDIVRAVDRNEAAKAAAAKKGRGEKDDKRNLYLMREGMLPHSLPHHPTGPCMEVMFAFHSLSEACFPQAP